ncbi:MAG: HIT domain-containing protein [candidate division Zixibacteria bacterium]|nr:HIT domain-containing protein [candidate division Zixibacteria bacterium]
MVNDCIFCRITAGAAPAKIIYENERVVVFHDHRPQATTHLLVVPKRHYATLLETPAEEVEYLFKVCRALAERLQVEEGFRLVINNGSRAGQIVFHVHVHFMSWIKAVGLGKIELAGL